MLRTQFLVGLLMLGLTIPAFPQEDQGQTPKDKPQTQEASQEQQQQNENQQNQNEQQQQQQQNQNQQNQNAQKSEKQVVDASLEQGQTITLPAGAQLLELTVAVPESLRSGQRYRYRARVRNISENTMLTNVRLIQMNGNQFEIESSQPKRSQPSSNSANTASWSLSEIKPGESKELAVTAIAGDTGNTPHCFAVTYQEALCANVEIVKPSVQITKSGPEKAAVCEIFQYRYKLTNTGTGVAKEITVRDPLPEGLKTKSGKDAVEFRVPELKEGASETFVAEVHAMKAGEYSSRAIAEQQSGKTHASKSVTTSVQAPELKVAIVGPRTMKADEGGSFDVTVTNTSDTIARNVVLTLDPGENMNVTKAGKGDARDGGKRYRYDLGNLKAQDKKTISLAVASNKEGTAALNAKATSLCALDKNQEAVAVAEAEASIQARVLKITSLLLSVVDTEDVLPTGEEITYRIRVRNQGSNPDEDVKVALELPSGLEFKEAEGPTSPQVNGPRVSLGTVEKIEPGQTLEWYVTANAESGGEKIVEATLDSKGLANTVESQEVSTFYNAETQKTQSKKTSTANKSGKTSKSTKK